MTWCVGGICVGLGWVCVCLGVCFCKYFVYIHFILYLIHYRLDAADNRILQCYVRWTWDLACIYQCCDDFIIKEKLIKLCTINLAEQSFYFLIALLTYLLNSIVHYCTNAWLERCLHIIRSLATTSASSTFHPRSIFRFCWYLSGWPLTMMSGSSFSVGWFSVVQLVRDTVHVHSLH